MNIEVKGCDNCPFCDMLDMAPGYMCNLRKKGDDGKYLTIKEARNAHGPVTPAWCPLKKEPITISIKEQ